MAWWAIGPGYGQVESQKRRRQWTGKHYHPTDHPTVSCKVKAELQGNTFAKCGVAFHQLTAGTTEPTRQGLSSYTDNSMEMR